MPTLIHQIDLWPAHDKFMGRYDAAVAGRYAVTVPEEVPPFARGAVASAAVDRAVGRAVVVGRSAEPLQVIVGPFQRRTMSPAGRELPPSWPTACGPEDFNHAIARAALTVQRLLPAAVGALC